MKISISIPSILLGCLIAFSSFAQTGPVPAVSLPGGATVVDDEPGPGELWGRSGGRTYTYSNFVLGNFTLLEWRSISAAMSFDGPVDAPGETMILDSLGPTSAVYTGSTTVTLTAGDTPVNTRFTVSLTGATFSGGTATVDVLLNPSFSVNVLFEAQDPNTSIWGPALDVFDALDTPPPPAEMLANTSFEQGFFFIELEGLSIAEHDGNMQDRADQIVGLLDFLTLETQGYFMQLAGEHDALQQQLNALLTAGGNEEQLQIIQSLVADNNQKLMDILFSLPEPPEDVTPLIACLWIGFMCPQQVPPDAPTLSEMSMDLIEILDGIDWAKEDIGKIMEDLASIIDELNANVVPTAIDLEVIHSNAASGPSHVFLVLSTVHGVPTTAAISVSAAPASGNAGFSLIPVGAAAIELAPGVQQVSVDLPGDLKNTQAFLITAERLAADDSVQSGATLTSRHDAAE